MEPVQPGQRVGPADEIPLRKGLAVEPDHGLGRFRRIGPQMDIRVLERIVSVSAGGHFRVSWL